MITNMQWYKLVFNQLMIIVCLISEGFPNKLIFSITSTIKEINLDTEEISDILTDIESNVHSMDYDYTNKYMYFAREDKDDISRFRYPENPGNSYTKVSDADNPISVAIDPVYNHVYWTERNTGKIYRCDFDGTNKREILNDGKVYALALDHKKRWLYYSTNDILNKSIKRSRLDGSDDQTLANVYPQLVTGLSIDFKEDRLVWMEHGNGDLKSSNFDGTDVIKIFSTNTIKANGEISVHGSTTYCANDRNILSVEVLAKTTAKVIHTDSGRILGVFYYKEKVSLCLENVIHTSVVLPEFLHLL
ncbi:low-density lipoprotein receptor-related protein 6-like isoform X1 [Mytilus trossulus]|uniref:low-density lipoprotein receptor-related protein 6-like isoform X1 n=1 Tax=Mytilus trossulus TaxID=6551 RepID=UPI0030041B69